MSSVSFRIISSDKVFFDGRCEMVIVPALDGELGIMPHHENMLIATKEGEARFQPEQGADWIKVAVGVGFVHIAHNRITMLVDTAERPEDIDEVRAQQALERAQEQLRQKQSIQEYHVSKASLARAMVRLKEAGKNNIQ